MYNGVWDKAPEAGEFSRIFMLKVRVNPTVCKVTFKVTFNCKLQKKMRQQDVLLAPPIVFGRATAPPVSVPMLTGDGVVRNLVFPVCLLI